MSPRWHTRLHRQAAGFGAEFLEAKVQMIDPRGDIKVDAKQRTNVPDVYAAGDVCAKDLRQVVTAVADGAVAALDMQYLASDMQGRTGQIPPAPVPRY